MRTVLLFKSWTIPGDDIALLITHGVFTKPYDAIWNALHEFASSEQCYYWMANNRKDSAEFGIDDWDAVPEYFFEHEGISDIAEVHHWSEERLDEFEQTCEKYSHSLN